MNPPPSGPNTEIEITIRRNQGESTNVLEKIKNCKRQVDYLVESGYDILELLADSTISASELGISVDDLDKSGYLKKHGYNKDVLIAWGFKDIIPPVAVSHKENKPNPQQLKHGFLK